MTYEEIIEKVAKESGIPKDIVEKTYRYFFQFIRSSIQEIPLKENLSEEDFQKLHTNFNVPSLGKFTCTYDRMCRVKKRFEYIKHLRENEYKKD